MFTLGYRSQDLISFKLSLNNPSKIRAFYLSEELKHLMRPLYEKHQDDIMTGKFSSTMMEDWANDDTNLLSWRDATSKTAFENTKNTSEEIKEQTYYDHGILMVAMVKAGVELAFEVMVSAGIVAESAYYESLHETPLIANTIARKKLFQMNVVISDTAEYGCYLFDQACRPLLKDFMSNIGSESIGIGMGKDQSADNRELISVNEAIRSHPVEIVGKNLRAHMTSMKRIV